MQSNELRPPNAGVMESSLKRVLDYKLVFDILADGNGMVRLETLTSVWPTAPTTLPRGCVRFWSEYANAEGYLDWERFSGGLEKALKADSLRLNKVGRTPPSEAEQTLQALQRRGEGAPAHVMAGEIEQFLVSCGGDTLMQALVRTRKEVYNCQRSLHTLTAQAGPVRRSTSAVGQVRRWSSLGSADISTSGGHSTPSSPIKGSGSMSVASEREELLRGMEVMRRTQKWYKDRMEQLSLEERQNSHTQEMRAEELLAALEPGSQPSETLRHLREINAHLISLALQTPAASPAIPSAGSPTKPLQPKKPPFRSLSMNTNDPYRYSSPTGRHKPKRSLSLKGSLATFNPPQQYPLRETFSMRELPHQHHLTASQQQRLRETSSMRNIPTHVAHTHDYTRTQQRDGLVASYPPPRAQQLRAPQQQTPVTDYQQTNGMTADRGKTKRKLSKTMKEQTARIQKLEAEKSLLIQQMFEKNATVHSPGDNSILSIL